MALPWLQRVELVLFAAAFLCGALAAATLTRTQVRAGGRAGRGGGGRGRSAAEAAAVRGAGGRSAAADTGPERARPLLAGRVSVLVEGAAAGASSAPGTAHPAPSPVWGPVGGALPSVRTGDALWELRLDPAGSGEATGST